MTEKEKIEYMDNRYKKITDKILMEEPDIHPDILAIKAYSQIAFEAIEALVKRLGRVK